MQHAIPTPSQNFSIPEQLRAPRGTGEKILIFLSLLRKWNPKLNLVSDLDLLSEEEFRQRHVVDSLQLLPLINSDARVLDIGSGAGFPALMLAAAGYRNLSVVESDMRKCEFIREAARLMGVPVTIYSQRVESLGQTEPFDVLTCRAFSDIRNLLLLTRSLHHPALKMILLKGKNVGDEIANARKQWRFEVSEKASITDAEARILMIEHITQGRHHASK